ncbi:hypothetical protein GSI_04612 [Ganoderma sinense ZZ0214-1]|uniref:Uncharacterized protein n=1 Tax=Ganoderma sinense ZZ0214-1 TaxID=1077348 RepID=A0A2G8SHC0_9APHY|nr:hypothetical protein GSI_04612 [Ganoderma sinense ZZ0214-1]
MAPRDSRQAPAARKLFQWSSPEEWKAGIGGRTGAWAVEQPQCDSPHLENWVDPDASTSGPESSCSGCGGVQGKYNIAKSSTTTKKSGDFKIMYADGSGATV